jgi:hypothetical protein
MVAVKKENISAYNESREGERTTITSIASRT